MRHAVEARTNLRAVDIYGLSEVMGPGVSQESGETQDGLHVWEDHFLPEVVDPFTFEPVADGEEGELVFTSLTKQAMPVVRYRTRDLTRLLPGTAYPAFRRMQKVTGRTDDMMIVRGVNLFPTQVEEQILTVEGLAPHYVCVLTRPGNLDELTVRVESVGEPDEASAATLAATLAGRIKHGIGVTARVEVVAPHALERSQGKARRISDQRGPLRSAVRQARLGAEALADRRRCCRRAMSLNICLERVGSQVTARLLIGTGQVRSLCVMRPAEAAHAPTTPMSLSTVRLSVVEVQRFQ